MKHAYSVLKTFLIFHEKIDRCQGNYFVNYLKRANTYEHSFKGWCYEF